MGFDPYNCSLNIRESVMTPTPKVGAHLGVDSLTFSCIPRSMKCDFRVHSWLAPL
jgi:hypothetical protein